MLGHILYTTKVNTTSDKSEPTIKTTYSLVRLYEIHLLTYIERELVIHAIAQKWNISELYNGNHHWSRMSQYICMFCD